MFSSTRRALPSAFVLLLLAACSGDPPPTPATSVAPESASPAAAPITDEAGLRAAASTALAQQRFYAPAGNNALDHYLALRDLRPDDANLATAMLELLPYAVIGIEQSVARQDLPEARRLLGLLERADPQAPSLSRLRDSIAAAEVSAAAAATQVLAQAERDAAAKLAAEQAARTQAAAAPAPEAPRTLADPSPTAAPPPAPVAAAPRVAAAAPAPAAPSTAAQASPAPAAPSAAAPAATAAIPRLLSAPSPRYPLMALRRKLEGQVTVQFTIQPDGSVAAPSVVSANPPGMFDEAALVAASGWRFEAGSRSVPSSRVVQFRLGEGQR